MNISSASDWVKPSPMPTQYVFTINGASYTWFTNWSYCTCYVNNKLKLAWVQVCCNMYAPAIGNNMGDYPILGQYFPKPVTGTAWIKLTNNYDYKDTIAQIKSDGTMVYGWGKATTSGMSASNWYIGTAVYPIA